MDQGLLDLSIELSSENILAGTEFSLYVNVRNPFSSPVWVREVNVTLPTDLRLFEDKKLKQEEQRRTDEDDRKRRQDSLEVDAQQQELREVLRSLVDELSVVNRQTGDAKDAASHDGTNSIINRIQQITEKLERNRFGSAELIVQGANIQHITVGSKASKVLVGENTKVGKLELLEPWQIDALRTKIRPVSLKSSLPEHAALNPGSTAIYTATLIVKKSIAFTPATYKLVFYVNYSFEQPQAEADPGPTTSLLTNKISYDLAIRAPIHAVILGAVVGGLFGSVARFVQSLASQAHVTVSILNSAISVIVAMILSGMAVVFLARKSNAQSFVSVEDFWGGLLMGFLVGYTGTSFFSKLTGIDTLTTAK